MAATDTVDEGTIPQFDIGVDTQLLEAEPFLGEVTEDTYERSDKAESGWQYHLAVRPLMFQLQGKSGQYHTWFNPSAGAKSKMGILLRAIKSVFPDGFGEAQACCATSNNHEKHLGRGAWKGTQAWFIRKDISYGKGRDGEPMVARDVLLPYKLATAEELALIPTTHTAGNAPTPPAPSYTDDDVNTLLAYMNGLTPREIVTKAVKDKSLEGSLKNAITTGRALAYLKTNNLVTEDEDGHILVAGDA